MTPGRARRVSTSHVRRRVNAGSTTGRRGYLHFDPLSRLLAS
jgi:hypothetical protein